MSTLSKIGTLLLKKSLDISLIFILSQIGTFAEKHCLSINALPRSCETHLYTYNGEMLKAIILRYDVSNRYNVC